MTTKRGRRPRSIGAAAFIITTTTMLMMYNHHGGIVINYSPAHGHRFCHGYILPVKKNSSRSSNRRHTNITASPTLLPHEEALAAHEENKHHSGVEKEWMPFKHSPNMAFPPNHSLIETKGNPTYWSRTGENQDEHYPAIHQRYTHTYHHHRQKHQDTLTLTPGMHTHVEEDIIICIKRKHWSKHRLVVLNAWAPHFWGEQIKQED